MDMLNSIKYITQVNEVSELSPTYLKHLSNYFRAEF